MSVFMVRLIEKKILRGFEKFRVKISQPLLLINNILIILSCFFLTVRFFSFLFFLSMVKKVRRPRHLSSNERHRRKTLSHSQGVKIPKEFYHKSIQAAWDPKLTTKQNYENLGLVGDTKKVTKIVSQSVQKSEIAGAFREFDAGEENPLEKIDFQSSELTEEAIELRKELEEAKRINESAPSYKVKSMAVEEQRRLAKLIERYGSNISAMARDFQLNNKQMTEAQLRKRIDLYEKLQSL